MTYNSKIGKCWIVWVGSYFQDRPVSSVLEIRTWGINLLLVWCMPHAVAGTEKNNQNSIWGHVCSMLPRKGWLLTSRKIRRKPLAIRPLESERRETTRDETQARLHWTPMEKQWQISCPNLSWLDRRVLSISWPSHNNRHILRGNLETASCCATTTARIQVPWDEGSIFRKRDKLAALQREQGRVVPYIPKRLRERQRPFNEQLRSDLEWQSRNWEVNWSQASSSSLFKPSLLLQ